MRIPSPNRIRAEADHSRSGQAIIEFAIVAFLLTFLLGAMLALGFLFFSANVLQQAADVGAMEFARFPYQATGNFKDGLEASALYTEAALVVEVGTDPDDLPLINRLLFSVYIYDPDIHPFGENEGCLRYPGTVVTNEDGDLTVVIPIVGNRNPTTGVETITEWRRVVEEVLPAGESEGPYAIDSTTTGTLDPGMVALRINYPYQSAGLVAYIQTDREGELLTPQETIGADGVLNIPVQADDGAVSGSASATFPDGETLATAEYQLSPSGPFADGASPHRGTFGLGEMRAYSTTVRPYRKVLSAQAIYRREVFE